MSLPQLTENLNIVQSLPNKPTQEANELKIKFDEVGNIIKVYINGTLIPAIETLVQNSISSAKTPIENSLESESTIKALSALQGKNLKDLLDTKQNIISYGTEPPTDGSDGDIYIQVFD